MAVQRGWCPALGRGSAGGTDGLSLLCFCLWPTCGGGRIRVRGWEMDVGQQETDGAAGPALLLAPFPPSCLRQAGDKPSLCPACACSPPHAAVPLPGQQAVGCSPQPSAPSPLQHQCKGLSPKHHSLAMDFSWTPGTPIPSPWGQPCSSLGAPQVTFLHGSGATCMCQRGGGCTVSSLYPNH